MYRGGESEDDASSWQARRRHVVGRAPSFRGCSESLASPHLTRAPEPLLVSLSVAKASWRCQMLRMNSAPPQSLRPCGVCL